METEEACSYFFYIDGIFTWEVWEKCMTSSTKFFSKESENLAS